MSVRVKVKCIGLYPVDSKDEVLEDLYSSTKLNEFEFTDSDCDQLCSIVGKLLENENVNIPDDMHMTKIEHIPGSFIRDDYRLRVLWDHIKTKEIYYVIVNALNVWDDPNENEVTKIRNRYKKGNRTEVSDECKS